MDKVHFELYLDESGNFEDEIIDPKKPMETSLVGGILVPAGKLTEERTLELLPEHVHCRDDYRKEYLDVLDTLIAEGMHFVIFENTERIKVINSDTTYLNIFSEGLTKLLRDLSNEYSQGVFLNITIAIRKAINADRGIIRADKYKTGLQEKLIMALGRSHVTGCDYQLSFEDARTYKKLDFADIICNTWLTRHRKKKFSVAEQLRIEQIYGEQMIYPVFEDAMTVYLKQLLFENHYGEALYQLCTLKKLSGFTCIRNQLIKIFLNADRYEQDTWFAQMSLMIGRYNRLRLYTDGICLAENYIRYFLEELRKDNDSIPSLNFWRFDTDYFLLTMYDHIGNTGNCWNYLQACKANIAYVNRSWEHIDYYFGFCIRELNLNMGCYSFEETLSRSQELIDIFTEARDLFGMIKTYSGTEQTVRSELLGKAYGVQLGAMINLIHHQPHLLPDAVRISDNALAEFIDSRDIRRQYQLRCLLFTEAEKPNDAFEALLQAVKLENSTAPISLFPDTVYAMKEGSRDFLLWHYTNVMLLMEKHGDPRGREMAGKLMGDPRFIADVRSNDKGGHPWNLVLWNAARYARSAGNYSVYKNIYRRAMSITRENKNNLTMFTFALSMSADKLLWCQDHGMKDVVQSQAEFSQVCKELDKIGMTPSMHMAFHMDEIGTGENISSSLLETIAHAYLK